MHTLNAVMGHQKKSRSQEQEQARAKLLNECPNFTGAIRRGKPCGSYVLEHAVVEDPLLFARHNPTHLLTVSIALLLLKFLAIIM